MKDKPIYLWPFIIVYRIVIFIIKLPVMLLHYMLLGLFFTFYFLFDGIITICLTISKYWYKFISFPFRAIKHKPKNENEKIKKLEQANVKDAKEHDKKLAKIKEEEAKQLAKEKAKLAKIEEKKKQEEELRQKKEAERQVKEQQELLKQEEKRKTQDIKNQMLAARSHTLAANSKNEGLVMAAAEQKPVTAAPIKEETKVEKTKQQIKEEKKKRREELKAEKKKLKEKNTYINENAKIEKKSLGDKINDGLEALVKGPANLGKKIKEKIANNRLLKNKKNQEAMEREALLINFDGADAEKSDKKIPFEYVAKNPDGTIVKEYFEAFSKVEVHSYLLSEGYEVYSIKTNKWIQLMHAHNQVSNTKMKTKDLLFFLAQLSTYIKAGIPLVESLRILGRQFSKNRKYGKLFSAMIYDLTMGDNFSEAMSKQGDAFPKILVNMVKASEMTGELPETLDDMYSYFTEADKTKKQMITAMTYPLIVLGLSVLALGFIMVYIVPKFTAIYEGMDNAELPGITIAITKFSEFLQKNWIYIILVIVVVIFVVRYLYKNVKLFRTMIQYFGMHMPVVKNIIIYNEVTMFTKTFASLLRHNVFITDTMDILNKITNNEVWKMIILDTITNLAKGEKISTAFKDHWAVPMPAYEMIVTGERTGQLPEMMQKVSDYYQELHKNSVGRIKSFIEPILILFLTGVVGVIVLSIVIPMFGMYDSIQ